MMRVITLVFCLREMNEQLDYKDTLGRMESATSPASSSPGCAWDSDDQVYVSDWGNNRIQVFDLPSYTSKEAENYATMSLAQLKRAARLSESRFHWLCRKAGIRGRLSAPSYNEAFTLNAQGTLCEGYVVKHDDRSDEQKAADEAIEKERKKGRRGRREGAGGEGARPRCRRSRTTANPLRTRRTLIVRRSRGRRVKADGVAREPPIEVVPGSSTSRTTSPCATSLLG